MGWAKERVSEWTDPLGLRTIRRGLLLGVLLGLSSGTAPAATQTRSSGFAYDPATGLLTKEVIEPGDSNLCLVTEYGYDAYGNKTSATTRNCNGSPGEAPAPTGNAVFTSRTSSAPFEAGSVTINGTTYAWSAGQFPTTTINALQQQETRLYDPRFGAVKNLTGPNSLTTSWDYDRFGRKTTETRADGTYTSIGYALCTSVPSGTAACPTYAAMVVTVSTFAPGGIQAAPTTKTYTDSLNREIRVETQGFDGTAVYKDTQYDARGRVHQVSKPYYAGQTPEWTVFAYDDLNRVRSETSPTTIAGIRKTTLTYSGLVTTTTLSNADTGTNLPQGVTQNKTITKNSQGQTVQVTDTQTNTVGYAYDPFGNLVYTNAGGVITTIEYDLRGRKKALNDPDMGRWEYDYSALGELVWQRDAKLQVTTTAYDKLGRMMSRTEPSLVSTWYYDTYKGGGTCNKGIGKLCEAEADDGFHRTVTYDSLGRVSQLTTTIDTTYTVTTAFVASGAHTGKVDTVTYPTQFAVKHVYTALGYLRQVLKADDSSLLWQANTLDAQGHVTAELLGNGLTTNRLYDALDRPTQITTSATGNTVQSMTFGYDAIGNLTSRSDAVMAVSETFVYDTLNRLRQASGSGLITRSFDYDPIGNMSSKSDVGAYTYPAIGSVRPHAVTSIAGTVHGLANPNLDYDPNGNLIRVKSATNDPCAANVNPGERCLAYTSFNLPTTIRGKDIAGNLYTYTYTYNAEHERVRLVTSRTNGTYTSIYLHPGGAGALLYEKEIQPGNLIEHKHYVQGIGVYVTKSSYQSGDGPQMRYYHKDHLGSIVAITNSTGAVIERLAYEAYGKRRFANGTADPNDTLFGITTDRGFTEHEHLDELALIHMNGRIYDPLLARFMTPDSIVQLPFNLQSYNRYSYGFNNPFAGSDPTGQIFGIDDLLFAVIVIGVAEVAKQTGLIDRQTFNIISGVTVGWLLGGPYALTSIAEANLFIAGTAAGFVSSGGTFEGAVLGGISAGFFYAAGSIAEGLGTAFANGTLGRAALHATVGCMMGEATGGGCGPGAASAGFAEFMGDNLNLGKAEYNLVARMVTGGTASVIAGDKFANGAVTAAFGYLFNCLAHECNGADYKGKDPGHEYGPFASPVTCNVSDPGCLAATQREMACNSAPGQGGCVPIGGADVPSNLSGGNPITQYRPNADTIINGTSDGHRYHDGYVVRWTSVDAAGDVRIWTYGIGVNSGSYMAIENKVLGGILFQKIGVENALNVRRALGQ